MSLPIPVFVSSGCYELRDIRAAIRELLKSFDIEPILSEDPGFPHESGVKPYVTCLDTLAECPLVIGVLERKYGRRFPDWEKYDKYNGLSPTHAEFRHALAVGAKFIPYVHRDTITAYEMWRKDKDKFAKLQHTNGIELDTLQLLEEMKGTEVAPWIIQFADASDIVKSLKQNLINEIYASLRDQRKKNIDSVAYFVEQFFELSPKARHDIQNRITPELGAEMERLRRERDELEESIRTSAQQRESGIRRSEELDEELSRVQARFKTQETMLALAAVRDAGWLHIVRTQFMPKQPGRVPFHNAQEVALRGFHVGPRLHATLESVTWSPLPYSENNLHRGYKAGLILHGRDFAPGVVVGIRYNNDERLKDHIHWHTPNIYFGEYLEISSNEDPFESPLGYRHAEFCAKNPLGQESPWVGFSYDFNDEQLVATMTESAAEGRRLIATNQPRLAVEPLRKAAHFAKNLLGQSATETVELTKEWNDAIDAAALARLRFRVGDRIRVIAGVFKGHEGEIIRLYLRHLKSYIVKLDSGEEVQFGDNEVGAAS